MQKTLEFTIAEISNSFLDIIKLILPLADLKIIVEHKLMADLLNKNSFCVLPWIHSFVNSDGNYQVCCTSEEHHPAILDNSKRHFNIKNSPDLSEIKNSEFMKEIRRDMLKGHWNPVCRRCLLTELNGGTSRRKIENIEYDFLINQILKFTKDNGYTDMPYISLDYRLGNLCNLQCRMCTPYSSTTWISDWNYLKPTNEHLSDQVRKNLSNYDWIRKDFLLEEFEKKLPDVVHLHFAGGEPLLAPQMTKMLKLCIEKNISQNITLTYNTNITHLPETILELWPKFKGIKLLCSIDGFEKINDYIRYPSRWETIDKNLTFLDSNVATYNIKEIILSTTVQAYNVMNLRELYKYLEKFNHIVPALNLINLYTPNYLQTTILPVVAKKVAKERLEKIAGEIQGKIKPEYQYLLDNIFQIITFMNQDANPAGLKEFIRYNQKFDELKCLTLNEAIPDLASILSMEGAGR